MCSSDSGYGSLLSGPQVRAHHGENGRGSSLEDGFPEWEAARLPVEVV